jgi:hypothetical protein
MAARMDLTQRLLTLGERERLLLLDLYQARFADDGLLAAFCLVSQADADALQSRGLLRTAQGTQGAIHYLTATGQRAALQILPAARSGARAYAALRLEHELLRARIYLALRKRGMPTEAYQAEPRLPYRSAAGFGERVLVPDASVEAVASWLIEVDRGTEGEAALHHKWLRYREWQLGARDGRRIAVLAAGRLDRLERSLAASGADATLSGDPYALAQLIWPGGEG